MKLRVLFLTGVLLVVALTVNLKSTPPLWWDEGWTLSVARNWVELGHYGRLLNGKLAPGGLEAGFPVTASVAFGFRLFGIGIVQARLIAVIYTLAGLALLYELARRFYNQSVALATLFVLMFTSGNIDINPLIVGRQVLAEIPALVFLLAGYLCFILAERRPFSFMAAAIFLWSVALFTKVQLQPFWAIALSSGLGLAIVRGQWKSAKLFGAGLLGSLGLYLFFKHLYSHLVASSATFGLIQTVALVLLGRTRLIVLAETLLYGIPLVLGLCWAFYRFLKTRHQFATHTDVVRFSLLALGGSWFAWFETLSLGWPRYLFPPAFLGSIFVAALLDDWTCHFDLAYTMERAGTALRKFRYQRENLCALAAVVLIAMSTGQTVAILYGAYVVEPDSSISDTLRFLNTSTAPDALIETYETELFFLLRRRYHYPPDQVHIDLIRRNSLGKRVRIDYDPLAANPDYLVVGPQSRFWDFYGPYLKTEAFRLLRKNSRYEIYKRLR